MGPGAGPKPTNIPIKKPNIKLHQALVPQPPVCRLAKHWILHSGYRSFVHDDEGSVFINEVCAVLNDNRSRPLWEVVTDITKRVASTPIKPTKFSTVGQCPEAISTMTKDFRFRSESAGKNDEKITFH